MTLFSELRDRKNPWLTQGWRYYPDPMIVQALDAIESFQSWKSYFDLGFVRQPADRVAMRFGGQVERQRE